MFDTQNVSANHCPLLILFIYSYLEQTFAAPPLPPSFYPVLLPPPLPPTLTFIEHKKSSFLAVVSRTRRNLYESSKL